MLQKGEGCTIAKSVNEMINRIKFAMTLKGDCTMTTRPRRKCSQDREEKNGVMKTEIHIIENNMSAW